MCGEDAEGMITSVFCMDMGTHKDKKCEYLGTIERARYFRDELVKDGWKKLCPPKVTFTFPGEKEKRELTRNEKRKLQKQLKKMKKSNPFE